MLRKDRKILNYKQMIKNRDEVIDRKNKIIKEQLLTIDTFTKIINSLEDELQELRKKAFENAK